MNYRAINKLQNMIIPSHVQTANTLFKSRTDSQTYSWEKDGEEVNNI
jgi:hypothetical protein